MEEFLMSPCVTHLPAGHTPAYLRFSTAPGKGPPASCSRSKHMPFHEPMLLSLRDKVFINMTHFIRSGWIILYKARFKHFTRFCFLPSLCVYKLLRKK